MSSEITKDDLNELKSEITALKELYEKELERETTERDSQATKDSEQLEISNAEKIAIEEQKAAEQEQETADREAEQAFRTSITDFFKEYKELNATVETLTAEQSEQERTEQGQFQMNVLVGIWLVVLVIIASNISNIFFNRMLRSWN